MKNSFLILLCFCYAVLFNLTATAQQPSAVIKKATIAPVIDGMIDNVWAESNVYNIERPFLNENPSLGEQGTSTWRALWTLDGIYILIQVNDNVFSPSYGGNFPDSPWMYDKPEIYFDVNAEKMDGNGAGTNGNGNGSGHYQFAPDFIYGQTSGGMSSLVGSNGALYSFNVSNPTYIAEYFIPFTKLIDKDGFEIDRSKPLGFDIYISDNDALDLNRSRAVWANSGVNGENWANMNDAGLVTLEGAEAKIYAEKITLADGSISTDNGSLQMIPIIEPADATIQKVKWSVSPYGYAQISSTGLLTAKKDGQVQVQAIALDGSSTIGTANITISGQVFQPNDINLIENGGFDLNGELSSPWGFFTNTTAPAPTVVNSVIVCTPVVAPFDWQYQFVQSNFQAIPNNEYILSFRAWAESPRTMTVDFEDDNNNYDKYGYSNDPQALYGRSAWAIDLSTTPTTYTFHVNFDQIKANTIQSIKFFLAAAPEVVYIDDISLINAEESTGVLLSAYTANFDADGGNIELNITSGNAWTAKSDQSWLTVDPPSGIGNKILTLAAEANPLMVKRSATVTVSSPAYPGSQTITVTQNEQPWPPKTLVLTAGGLRNALAPEELAGITQLILTGTMDARDFKTMRDEMPKLAVVDLSGATIVSYTGTEGTSMWGKNVYVADEIPETAFLNNSWQGKTTLTSIMLPSTATSIGRYAFCNCLGLNSINIPSSVTSIRSVAFSGCTSLTSVSISSFVTTIEDRVFDNCSGLIYVDAGNANYSSLDGVLFNKTQTVLIHCPDSKAGNYSIPSTVISIKEAAFWGCQNITSISFPSSLKTIGDIAFTDCTGLITIIFPSTIESIGTYAFQNCTGLSSITVEWPIPLNLNSSTGVFNNVNTSICTLHVPYGSKAAYQAANQWKDFTNIVEETNGYYLSANEVTIGTEEQSTATVSLTSNVSWTVTCDQSWLTISPASGNDNQTLTFTAQANTSAATRTAAITVSAEGFDSQILTVTQSGSNAPVNITAGGLSAAFTPEELAAITRLTLTGTIDARDFKTMRDQMPMLAELDISQATIVAYSGLEGTSYWGNNNYPSHTIPETAFMYYSTSSSWQGKNSLTSVILPASLLSIGENAFYNCMGLTTLSIPSQVTNIDPDAFSYCKGLISVFIPASMASIGERAFMQCPGLLNVEAGNPYYSSLEGVLFNKNQTVLIQCPTSKAGAYVIPSSVRHIRERAFEGCNLLTSVEIPLGIELINYSAFSDCSGLTSLSIPSSVKTIGSYAFAFDQALTSIYVHHSVPLNLNENDNVFFNVNKTTCTLQVPYGSKAAYQAAYQWQDFTNIVEAANGFNLSAQTINLEAEEQSTATVSLTGNVSWTAACDQSWITVSPVSGNGNQTLTFTAQSNNSVATRTAIVTVSAEGIEPQILTVTQSGSNAPVNITAGGLSTAFTPEELAAITQLTLTGTIDARDFKTMRDQMPLLAELDISQATIVAYSGTEGTSLWDNYEYPANAIPEFAFFKFNGGGKTYLTSIVFPESLYSIGTYAFRDCRGITAISIPSTVTNIGSGAFSYFVGLINVDANNLNYSSLEGVLLNKDQTILIVCPISKTGEYSIPNSVKTVSSVAFESCTQLSSIRIPASVHSIQYAAFWNCSGLSSIYSYKSNAETINLGLKVFNYVNKSSCIIHVPYGSKSAYQTASQWQDFTNIVEDTHGFLVASTAVIIGSTEGSQAFVSIKSNINWQAESNQSWLTVTPVSGSTDGSLTLTASRNSGMPRTAIVRVWAEGEDSQLIYVTQNCQDAIADLNIIKDGNFAIDGELSYPWGFWSNNGAIAPVVVNGMPICTPKQDANEIWNYTLSQSNLQALPNKDYVLSFTAWAATNRAISVTFQDINNDYQRYGTTTDPEAEWGNLSQWKLNITTVPTTYTLHVNFDRILPNTNQQIAFLMAHTSDIVYIDNVTLVDAAGLILVTAPTARAGQDQIVDESMLVTLDGSLSSDPNDDALTYKWTAPSGITLSSDNVAKPTFTAPEVTTDQQFIFSLVVNDGTTDSPVDQVVVTVKNAISSKHFTPVWSGNGVDHMNINIYSAILDGVELEAGDEIGIFDGENCVGAGVISAPITIVNTLDLVVSRNDGSGNGYESGNSITYKFYDKSKGVEVLSVSALYSSTDPSWSTDGNFAIGATAFTALNGVTKVNQDIALTTGWNIISTGVVPSNLDMKAIFQPLIDQGKLQKVMDETGKTIEYFALMGTWKNNIGSLNPARGYKVKVTDPVTLSVEGMPLPLPYEIPLNQGWNIISFPCLSIQDAKAMVQPLIDQGKLQKVMDEAGSTIEYFALMGTWKNNIGNFKPGKGYKVKVTENCVLTIPANGTKSAVLVDEVMASEHFKPVFMGNGTDHMNIHLLNLQSSGLQGGDEIGAFDGKNCVGSITIGPAQLIEGSISIAASASDGMEQIINGFIPGHRVELYLYRNGQTYPLIIEKKSGNESFEKNASLFATVNALGLVQAYTHEENVAFKCYPNPFTEEIAVEILDLNQEKITVEIYNMAGQKVKSLYKGDNGKHMVLKWKGDNDANQKVTPGIYLCKVNGQTNQIILK